MSLTDKLKIGQTGKKAVLAGTLAGVLAVSGCSGCRNSNYDSSILDTTTSTEVCQGNKDKKPENKQEYTFEEFKRALGSERLTGAYEKEFKRLCESDDERLFRKIAYDIYANKSLEYLSFISGEDHGEEYKEFNVSNIPASKFQEYEKKIPWRLFPKESEEDRMMIYAMHVIDKKIDEAAAEYFAKMIVDFAIKPMIEAMKDGREIEIEKDGKKIVIEKGSIDE